MSSYTHKTTHKHIQTHTNTNIQMHTYKHTHIHKRFGHALSGLGHLRGIFFKRHYLSKHFRLRMYGST